MSEKPIIGITMGDPAGNGPEITVKAWPMRICMTAAAPRGGRRQNDRAGGPFVDGPT